MPCIHIRTKRVEHEVHLQDFSSELSQQMRIPMERVNIIVDYYEETEVVIGRDTDFLMIVLWISESNEEQFIKDLVKTTAVLAEKYFCKKEKSAAVICNLFKKGHLFVNDQFI